MKEGHWQAPPLQKYIFLLWFALLTALAAVAGYYRMFTGFSIYDDEGELMVTVKQYLGGMKLYNQIVVPYGPVYYFYNWALRTLSRTPVTHDVVRVSSLIPMLLSAVVSAWIVFRFTNSLVLASGTHLLTFLTLSNFFHKEPGHPQELCILLLVCLVACGIVISNPSWRLVGMVLLGALTAGLFLVKVNIGVFVFLAASLALLSHSPATKLSRFALTAVAAACVILPAVLMHSQLDGEAARLYAALVTISSIAMLLVLFRVPRTCCFSFRDSWIAMSSFACTFVGIILVLKVQGIVLTRVLHALVLDSLGTFVNQRAWYLPLPVQPMWLLWIVSGLAAAGFFCWNIKAADRMEDRLVDLKILLATFTVGILLLRITIFAFATPLLEIVQPLFALVPPIFALVPPFCWLVLYGGSENKNEAHAFPRTLLCTVTVMQMLYAYPIAGSQLSFIQVLPIIVGMICLGDFLLWQQKRLPAIRAPFVLAATSVLLICVAASYLAIARSERADYDALPSLDISGAGRVHLQASQGQDYRWLVQTLNDHCDVFVGLPELPSLHIWTGKDPLEGMDIDDWMLSSTNEQQIDASTVLSEHPNACEIYNPDIVDFWNRTHRNLDGLPLVRYLHENFKVVGQTGRFFFLIRNERNLDHGSTSSLASNSSILK
jgi:hypothetical protein